MGARKWGWEWKKLGRRVSSRAGGQNVRTRVIGFLHVSTWTDLKNAIQGKNIEL